jgi:hypothetical protein
MRRGSLDFDLTTPAGNSAHGEGNASATNASDATSHIRLIPNSLAPDSAELLARDLPDLRAAITDPARAL